MKKIILLIALVLGAGIIKAQAPHVAIDRYHSCSDAEEYFITNSSKLASIEGVWAITWEATQYSPSSSRPKVEEIETTFYIIRAEKPNDCFGVYVCHDDKLDWYCSIQEFDKGLYYMGWAPKTCEKSDIKSFRVKNNSFTIRFRNLSNKLKKQIFKGIGRDVTADITISGEKIDYSEY